MAASLTDVENEVAALLAALGRTPVQGRVGEGPAPASKYAGWYMRRIELQDSIRSSIESGQQVIVAANTPLEFMIDLCGGDAMGDAVKFGLSLRQSQRTSDLYKIAGLSGVSEFLDISGVELGVWRNRVNFRLSLFAALDLTAAAEQIEEIPITVNVPAMEHTETVRVTDKGCE